MRRNRFKAKLLRDEIAVGVMTLSADLHAAGVLAEAGFDCVMPDQEHTSVSLGQLEALVRAADAAGIAPAVRVPGSRKPEILAALDTGVQAIMVPMVESAAEAARVAEVSRYAPEGTRGVFYLGYNAGYGSHSAPEHFASANRELLIIAQIESAAGVERAAEIAAIPGIDCLLVGPADLSQSLGVLWQFDHPALGEAIGAVFRAARGAGKVAGIMPAGIDHASWCVEQGARLLLWGPEMALLRRAAREDAALLRERLGWRPAPEAPP